MCVGDGRWVPHPSSSLWSRVHVCRDLDEGWGTDAKAADRVDTTTQMFYPACQFR